MREIKFRGKTFGNVWVYGNLVRQIKDDGVESCFIRPIKVGDKPVSIARISKNTIGQFTGLHDKNGKEIYEGDIVATKLNDKIITVGDIQFHCGVFGAEWRHAKKDKTMVGSWGQRHNLRRLDDDIIEEIEVIGNIYDNPELIKE